MIEDKWITKFKELFKEEFGEEITDDVAREELNKLLIIVKAGSKQKARASPNEN